MTKFLGQEICIVNSGFWPWQKCLPRSNETVEQHDRLLLAVLQLGAPKGSPREQEAGLAFPEEPGAFSCLQLLVLWRAVECRLAF